MSKFNHSFISLKKEFEEKSGLSDVRAAKRQRVSGDIYEIYIANPTIRFFDILEDITSSGRVENDSDFFVTLKKSAPDNPLVAPEGVLFLRTLSESQNVNRYTFGENFFDRYTPSATNAESQIMAEANSIVLGRRGAGKSMLLLYALNKRESGGEPFVWIDMQVYARRNDAAVAADLIKEIVSQVADRIEANILSLEDINILNDKEVSFDSIRKLLPEIKRGLSRFAKTGKSLFIFIDDYHVVDREVQPKILDLIYSICRGNQLFLKISSIEALTRTYDQATGEGLEVPQDAQFIKLDYNLTAPDMAAKHIESILDSHARYSGLSSARSLCTSPDVLSRLTWVAAGVPRDALSLFSQAITKATAASRKRVSVSNVNQAASETLSTKLIEFESDAGSSDIEGLRTLLNNIKEFCVTEQRRNAFLVKIESVNDTFSMIRELVSLRLLHVITEGITVEKAGEKYMGLILDYGFYTGIRAAQSVDLFNKQTKSINYKDLRRLPVFRI